MITISETTATALSNLGIGDFCECETPERMAYVLLVLKELADTPERFPKGKWATIQHIEGQLQDYIARAVRELKAGIKP